MPLPFLVYRLISLKKFSFQNWLVEKTNVSGNRTRNKQRFDMFDKLRQCLLQIFEKVREIGFIFPVICSPSNTKINKQLLD